VTGDAKLEGEGKADKAGGKIRNATTQVIASSGYRPLTGAFGFGEL
jgi:hypothetical protein